MATTSGSSHQIPAFPALLHSSSVKICFSECRIFSTAHRSSTEQTHFQPSYSVRSSRFTLTTSGYTSEHDLDLVVCCLHHLHNMHIPDFIITSCVHDYSPFTFAFTPTTQCLFVPLYPCSIVVLFCCDTPVYITLCTSCKNLHLQSQFDLITPIVII